MNGFVISNDLLTQPEGLRQRAREDGYLFLRGLIDRASLQHVRRQILDLCAEAGWLAPGADPMEGIAAPGVRHIEPEPAFMAVYDRVMRLEDFHALAHHPSLIAVLDTLFGEPTLPHARNITRIIFPQATAFTTPAHQDYVHIQGTPETWTAWMPLADCPQEQGSLAVLPGSHRQGLYPVHRALGAGGLGIDTEALPFAWAASDFEAGDVLLFHSHLVHKGLPNVTPDRLRISVDYRYQGVSQPLVEDSMRPHYGQLCWEEIYSGWQSARYQYYWRGLPLSFVEWTPQYHRAAEDG
ncbi:MAG: phytanoyl-CoA dioxygenase family protein [Armatimonadetes bacterium]|nr:phytanoyl-CoA dioxygenase family protein [Armatimonadota bacterium]